MIAVARIGRVDFSVNPSLDDLVRSRLAGRLAAVDRFARQRSPGARPARLRSAAEKRPSAISERGANDHARYASSSGISISSSAELNDLPWASSASVRVTPPPTTPCRTKFSAPIVGQLVADDLTVDRFREERRDARGRDVAREPRVVALVERDERDVEDRALVAGSRVGDRAQLHVTPPRNWTAHDDERRAARTWTRSTAPRARAGRRAAAAGRTVRVQRLDLAGRFAARRRATTSRAATRRRTS